MDEAADVYISAQHSDVIHDVAFDLYGKRMATCASDHTVKIWDLDASGCWQVSASFKAHNGSVWKVAWAHPEFGQVLATCSFDRTVAIWEEQAGQGKKKGTSVWDVSGRRMLGATLHCTSRGMQAASVRTRACARVGMCTCGPMHGPVGPRVLTASGSAAQARRAT